MNVGKWEKGVMNYTRTFLRPSMIFGLIPFIIVSSTLRCTGIIHYTPFPTHHLAITWNVRE